jgi:hypothetical protein
MRFSFIIVCLVYHLSHWFDSAYSLFRCRHQAFYSEIFFSSQVWCWCLFSNYIIKLIELIEPHQINNLGLKSFFFLLLSKCWHLSSLFSCQFKNNLTNDITRTINLISLFIYTLFVEKNREFSNASLFIWTAKHFKFFSNFSNFFPFWNLPFKLVFF